MPGEREEELKRRLASVLWDAVEECVQRLDAESVNEKSSVKEMPAGEEHSFKCCGEIKHIPPAGPAPKEDSTDEDWKTMLEPMLKEDRDRCESWDKEVQNILIFAALFSAVVTSFLLQSISLLSPASQAGTTDATEPLPASIRINVFWSLSLVLSVTTALIGIIAAQWLREHLSYPEYLTSEQVFALLNMKISMLKKWNVRGVISSLSLLLQLSLLLFFAGLVQYLLYLKVNAVTIPVTILIALSTLFPLITTVLPALHVYVWQKGITVEGDVPVPCPYKSPQAELFYVLSIALSKHRPFPELFSLFYTVVTFIPTALVTSTILAKFYLYRTFSKGERANLGRMLLSMAGKPITLFLKTLERLSTAADRALHYLHEVRINVRGSIPIHYNRTMTLFRPAMEDESEPWWAFDVAWVSIRRDYAFRLYASRAWSGKIDTRRRQIIEEWENGEGDHRMAWGKANSREANARAGPPLDQIQGLIILRHQYQHNDSDVNIMEAALRCFKACVSPFRAYDKLDNNLAEINSWMIGFEDATTEILRPHIKDEVTFSNLAQHINESSPIGLGIELCTASFYHEALFHFLGNFHLEKLTDTGEARLKTAWVEIYYKLVRCLPSSEDLQHIDVPFAFATCSRDVSSVTPQFSEEEEKDLQEIYLEKAKSCAERLDKYRAEGAIASDGLRNQVLHDFFFAIGAPPFYARQDKIPADIQKLVSSLSEFCQYVKQRHNPNVVNLADRIESALGDTVDNYLEDSQLTFSRVAELPPDYSAIEMEPLVSREDVVPSPGPSHASKGLVEQESLIKEPLVPVEEVMSSPGPSHLSKDLVEQESLMKEPLVPVEDAIPLLGPSHLSKDLVKQESLIKEPLVPVEDVMPLPGPSHLSKDLVEQESPTQEPLVSREGVMSPSPTHEDTMPPSPTQEHVMSPPSHSSNDLVVEDSPINEPQVHDEVVMPFPHPHYTFNFSDPDDDPWEGRTDLW